MANVPASIEAEEALFTLSRKVPALEALFQLPLNFITQEAYKLV